MSVTVHLKGGMGNQMFQYATGRALALRLGTDLRLDVSSFDTDGMRAYSLGLWKGVTAPCVRGLPEPVIREQGMPYNPGLFANVPAKCALDGYWQTERYFAEIESLLQQEFTSRYGPALFHQEIAQKILAEGDRSVFLTVRRTDYVGNSFHGLLPFEYYLQAAGIIAARVPDPCFFIFSDEPDWCRDNFNLPYRTVIGGNYDRTVGKQLGREDAELRLMSMCKHAVGANSSYSWWGAWLNPDRDRIVVMPQRWFANAPEDPRDIVPDRWIRL